MNNPQPPSVTCRGLAHRLAFSFARRALPPMTTRAILDSILFDDLLTCALNTLDKCDRHYDPTAGTSYIYISLTRALSLHLRAHRARLARESAPRPQPPNPCPSSTLEARDTLARLFTVLPPDALPLFTLQAAGHTREEIAAALSLTPSLVKDRLETYRARARTLLPS